MGATHRKRRRWTTRSAPACRPASRRPGACARGPTRGRGPPSAWSGSGPRPCGGGAPNAPRRGGWAGCGRVAAPDGVQAVSMSRVAADLGASTMSLYRYVAAKNELLALMADLTFEAPPAPRGPDEGWRAGLSRWAA